MEDLTPTTPPCPAAFAAMAKVLKDYKLGAMFPPRRKYPPRNEKEKKP